MTGAEAQGDRLERQIGHYLSGAGTKAEGAARLELWTTASQILKRQGAATLAARLEYMAAEVIATYGAQR
jgi:hypothetical protein